MKMKFHDIYHSIIEEAKKSKKLDPVGKEDDDIDNDGKKNTKRDKFLKSRRTKVSKAIVSKNKKKSK
jgi:hypothetical protein